MGNVFSFLKPYRLAMAVALLLMLIELVVELVQPLLMAKIIDEGIMKQDLEIVTVWGVVMVALSLLSFAAGVTNSFFSSHVSQSFGYDLRIALMEKVQAFTFNTLQNFSNASLITRMTNDVTQVQNTVFMGLRIMMRAPLLLLGGAIMALAVNVKLALILVLVIPVLFVFLVWALQLAGRLFQSVQKRLDAVNTVMRENLSGMRLIKAFVRGAHEVERFEQVNGRLRDRTVTALRLIEFTLPVLLLFMNLAILGVLWFGKIEVDTGSATVGDVVAIINYGTRMTSALSVLTWVLMVFSRARASAGRIAEVFKAEEDRLEADNRPSDFVANGAITFDQVFFKYPESGTTILDDITFSIGAGEWVAILGETGSGKTSLFQLIPRLYEPVKGRIFIGGQEIRSINALQLRKEIGYVPQVSLLFTGTVKENIAWGKEDATMQEIIKAASAAQIHDTITALPNGYDTRIGQKGVNLSGGQKQRLSIARALVRKPKILLLDDSTSALDLKTEGQLLEAIGQYQCTTMIITQKIETARKADRILLLADGKVIGIGNHEQLLKESSLYRKIAQSQHWKGEEQTCSNN